MCFLPLFPDILNIRESLSESMVTRTKYTDCQREMHHNVIYGHLQRHPHTKPCPFEIENTKIQNDILYNQNNRIRLIFSGNKPEWLFEPKKQLQQESIIFFTFCRFKVSLLKQKITWYLKSHFSQVQFFFRSVTSYMESNTRTNFFKKNWELLASSSANKDH